MKINQQLLKVIEPCISKIVMLSFVLTLASFAYKGDKGTYSLTVEVHETRNSKGVVQFALYNKDGSIPDQKFSKYYKLLKGTIIDGSSSVTFKDLPDGRYVINVLHDENNNGKVDKGFILPIEGLGFSNYQSLGPTNRPKYSKASFELQSDTTIVINVVYM